ncbi:MAG: hypothetical protein C0415_01935 [Thermodesulfovibrio sp.]|nr:hypothetical protein [Thermodesulfovibrio sp.]
MKKSGDKDNPKKQKEPKVTVKNKVKEISQHSKNKYRAIFENTGSATIIIEEDGIISLSNKKFGELSGYSNREVDSRKSWTEFFTGDVLNKMKAYHVLRRIDPDAAPRNYESLFVDRSGDVKSVIVNVDIIPGTKRSVVSLLDVTKLKKAEKSHLESEAKYRTLVEQIPAITYISSIDIDRAYSTLFISPQVENILGFLPGEWVEDSDLWLRQVHPDDKESVMSEISRCRSTGKPLNLEYRIFAKDGRLIWVRDEAVLVRDRAGRPLFFQGIMRDITERKHTEDAMKQSKIFYQTLSENLPGIVYRVFIKENNRMEFFNDMIKTMTGFTEKELTHGEVCSFDPLILPEDREDVIKTVKHAIINGEPFHVEYRLWCKDGHIRYFSERGKPIHGEDGKPAYIDGVIFDITERKQKEEYVRSILESIGEGLIVVDPEYRIVSANKAYSDMVKMPVEFIIGRYCYEASHHINKPCHMLGEDCPVKHAFKTGEPYIVTHAHTDEKGNPLFIETKSYPIKDASGRVSLVIEVLNDITEQRKLEDQLRHSQKMEAIGQLTGGIAHDFNNILQSVIGYGSLLQMKIKEDDPSRKYIDNLLISAERAANLTKNLLSFSRKRLINPMPVNLNIIIKNAEKLLSRIIGEDIELKTELSNEKLIVKADYIQIEQVLMNLVTNARDAMSDGGHITIETGILEMDSEFIKTHGYGKKGKYALFSVTDTGTGMDDKTRQKIFEPFFTTKDVGKGTGLGMSIVYGIIKQHSGFIAVYSEIGEGTTFRIYLPLIKESEIKTEEAKPVKVVTLTEGTETVLLAEDERRVRDYIKETLERFGYKVIEAVDGYDALEKFKENKDKVQLLFLDVIMPKMNGKEVYKTIKKMKPAIKVIFASGYPADIIAKKGILEKGFAFISKPVSPTELLRKVREVLDN